MQQVVSAADSLTASYEGFHFLSPLQAQTKEEIITQACVDVLKLPKEIENHSRLWSGNKVSLQSDLQLLDASLTSLENLREIDDKTKQGLIPTLSKVYRTLDILKEGSNIDLSRKNKIHISQGMIKTACFGLGPELCQLASLVDVEQQLAEKQNPEDFLLDVKEGRDLSLVPIKNAHSAQQKSVFDLIKQILLDLKKHEVVKHFTVQQLMQMKIAVNILMANYVFHQEKGLDNSEHIFTKLKECNSALDAILANRPVEEYASSKNDRSLDRLVLVKEMIAKKLFNADFWSNPESLKELKECESFLQSCKSFISNPDQMSIDSLVFLGKDEKAGIALYELPSDQEDVPKALVAFSYNKDHLMSYYNCFQSRKSHLELGGLGHEPVFESGEKCWAALNKLIADTPYENKNIKLITAGFGIDGAIAQILGYLWTKGKNNPESRCYMLGVAPFLDVNAAATFSVLKNHFALNFVLTQDRSLGQSALGTWIQKEYSGNNFHLIVKLFNRDWFKTDLTGHDLSIYLSKIGPGLEQAKDMHKLHKELDDLLKIVGTTKRAELPQALHQFFQNKK